MKRLAIFCFCLLFSVLSALSILNFDGESVAAMEGNMRRMMIVKPEGMSNLYFLHAIDNALNEKNVDIMMRVVSVKEGKSIYKYYKTNHTDDFIDIKSDSDNGIILSDNESIATVDQEGYITYRLALPALSQDIAIFDWYELKGADLLSGIYYVKKSAVTIVSDAISNLGLDVTLDKSTPVQANYSFWMFGTVPAFLFIISVTFYMLSIAKKNMLRRIDGYSGSSILNDELKNLSVPLSATLGLVLFITITVAALLFKDALGIYLKFYLTYFVIGVVTTIVALVAATIVTFSHRKVTHSKGNVPQNGIYFVAILSKCVILLFLAVFLSVSIRNILITYSVYSTAKNLSEKVSGYMTIPIYVNNASLNKEAEKGYLQFYIKSVSMYDGILINSSNYYYDVTTGQTIREQFPNENRDYITVNRNYIHFNPILLPNGEVLDESTLSDNTINVLIPQEKTERIDVYREWAQVAYSCVPNILIYSGQHSKIHAYNPKVVTNHGLIDQPIIIVMEDRFLDAAFITSYISQGAYFIKPQTNSPYSELRALFKEVGIDAYTLGLRSVAENYDNVITQQLYMLRIYGAQTVFLLIGLVSLVVFTASLYCENYKVKIAACMIEGYSLLKCIWGHIFLTLFIYGVSILTLQLIENMFSIRAEILILPLSLLVDIVVTYCLCRRYSRANLYSIMKGAD